jgi:hypothetical protein
LLNQHKTNKQWLEYHVRIAAFHAQVVQVPDLQLHLMAQDVAQNVSVR